MKTKFFKLIAGFLPLLASSLWAAPLKAQDGDYIPLAEPYDFLAIKNINLSTTTILDKTGQPVFWTGEYLHTGIQNFQMALIVCGEVPENVDVPENPSYIWEIRDPAGSIIEKGERNLSLIFKYLDSFSGTGLNSKFTIVRGGEYKLSARITPELFSYEKQITLMDEPGIRMINVTSDVNAPLCPEVTLTSGYPYEPAEITGEKHLHWQVTPIDSPTDLIIEKDEVFELKSDTPVLAAISTLYFPVEGLDPGEYLYTVTSDDFAPANNSFTAFVYDVLMPDITLDRSIYTAGKSNEANLKVEMNYSYPYVGVNSSYDKPTITVCAELLNEETSVSYSDEAWADSDMHCLAELKVPLEKVTTEVVDEYNGEIPLNLTVKFNDATKFNTTVILPFEKDSSGIDGILTDDTVKENARYNLQGIRVPANTKGFVIIHYSDGSRRKVFVE